MKQLLPLVLVLLSIPIAIQAQIQITSTDLNKPVGYVQATEYEFGPLAVNLGSPGGPQNWDFSSYTMSFAGAMEVVSVAGTPFANDFPNATTCFANIDDVSETEAYSYMTINSGSWSFLGIGVVAPDTSYVQHWSPIGHIPLPVDYGDSWVYETGFSDTLGGIIISLETRNHATVNAWGTMTIPLGSFSVLRVVSYDTTITSTIFPPFEFSDTSATIGVEWMGRDPIYVASATSVDGETNPNFTTADIIERAAIGDVGIGDDETAGQIPHTFGLDQNFPNPFNPQTEITFTVDEESAGQVELSVYSMRGARVKTLVSSRLAAGRYTKTWNGRNDRGEQLPSGVYIYRLTVDGQSIARKMVLAR